MSNPNPKTEQLAKGRGKRPKLNNQTVGMRMSGQTRQQLENIAQSYDCTYGGKPWIAGLLERIAKGELMVVPAPPTVVAPAAESSLEIINPKQMMRQHLQNRHYKPAPAASNDPDKRAGSKNSDVSRDAGRSRAEAGVD
ncbi:MAG: hypothetical protein AAF289_04940 [Cyanobacteria bacterium P01_A01_bin.135]